MKREMLPPHLELHGDLFFRAARLQSPVLLSTPQPMIHTRSLLETVQILGKGEQSVHSIRTEKAL